MQQNIKQEEDVEWVKDEHQMDDDADVVKLQVGEIIQGLLVDKYRSTKYNAGIYKIKVKDDERLKIILGTTVLDKIMEPKQLNEPVMIKRLPDGKTQSGRCYQNWETYHLHRSSSL